MTERKTEKFKADFQEILNLFSDPAAVITEDHRIVCINEAFAAVVDGQTDLLLSKPLEELPVFNQEAKTTLLENLKKRLQKEKIEPYEIALNVNGRTLYFEPAGKRIDYRGNPIDIVLLHDVSAQRKMHKQMMAEIGEEKDKRLQSEIKAASVLESSPDALAFCSMDGKVLECNQAMVDLFHFKTKNDLVGKNGFELILNDDSANASKAINDLLKQGVVSNAEMRSTTVDGEELFVIFSGRRLNDASGSPVGFVAAAKDVTKRKKLELKLREAEMLYRSLFEQGPLGVVVIDPETTAFVEFNDVAHRQLGYSREEFGKLRISDVEALNDSDQIRRQINQILRDGQDEFITKHRTKNRTTLNILVNVRVIELSGKKLLLSTWHDVTGIKKMQNALRSSEERFLGMANSVKDAMILIDEKAKVTYWNPAAETMFGYTSKEAMGKNIHSLVVPNSMSKQGKERIGMSVKTFAETGLGYFTVGNVELVGCRKDGTEFPAELSIASIKLLGRWNAVGVVKDVSRRKQAEQKLRDAEQRYHALFNQAPLGVLVADPETGSFIEFNDVAHLQLGYSREEFEDKTVFNIEAKESTYQTIAHLKQMVQEGGGEFETFHRTKDGDVRNVLVTTRAFQSAGKVYLHCIFHDITEIRRVQNSLLASEARYHQLVEVAQEGIWAIDNTFTTTLVNPRMAQMLEYTETEILGRKLFDFLDSNMVDRIRDILIKFSSNPASPSKEQYEYAFPTKSGKHIQTNVTISKITNNQGIQTGFLAVVTDITERKRVEKALKESEELSKAVVANSSIGIATSNNAHQFVSANEAFCKTLGYTEAELQQLTVRDLTHPDDIMGCAKKMSELVKGHINSFMLEMRYIKKDGSTIIGRSIISAIRNQTGQPILFIVELEDITRSKQLEGDLRASEERFRAISTSAMDGIILCDEKGRIIYWNPAAEQAFGYLEKEAVGKQLTELFVAPQELKTHPDLVKEVIAQSSSKRHVEVKARRRDGTTFPVDLSIVTVKLEDKNCLLAIVRDVTDWKAMKEALIQERDMLENMAANINAGLAIIDRNYKVVWANKLLKQISGRKNLENCHCYTAFHNGATVICKDCGVKKIFEQGTDIDRHDYHVKKPDHELWIELIVTPIKDAAGRVVAALELAVDVTERKQLQNKRAEYSQKLEELVQRRTAQLKETQAELVKSERLAAIGELANMIGHDLRNPLTGIKNSVYYLRKKGSDLSLQQTMEMLEIIDRCVDSSNRIVNDLLDYSRELHLELEETSPEKLLNDALTLLSVPEKVQVVNNLTYYKLIVDSGKMKRVFINLIKNAIDAMPNGGKITVSCEVVKGHLEISFADTGTGISKDVLPKLFTPLITTKAQGMGFGLAICKRVIEAHGGAITVKTALGEGTTFTLKLPMNPTLNQEVKNHE